MEDRDRWKRYFRPLRSLGSDEYSLGWSCASSGATRRDQGWTIRFCLRTSARLRASPGTSRRARSWKEEQVSAAGAKIPRITGRLEGIDAPFGRQIVAGKEAEREIFQRNQNHGEAVSADHSAASCGRQNLGRGSPRLRSGIPAQDQNSALPGVLAKGMTSRILGTPVTNISMRSKPRPKPECGTVP